jgi:predicted transcriptional regulator YdeE
METKLVSLHPLLLGGLCFYGDPISAKGGWDSENEIGKTWSRFSEFLRENPDRPYSSHGGTMYEIHIYGIETRSKGYFEVFVGEEVNTAQLPIALSTKFIPASDYLKITLNGNEITGDWWHELDTKIMPSSGSKRNFAYLIQAYDEKFKGMDKIEDSILDVYIPVEKA